MHRLPRFPDCGEMPRIAMLSLSDRKGPHTAGPAFKARVQDFWRWYAERSATFYDALEQKQSARLEPEVSAKVDDLLPEAGWVFGVDPGRNGYSFTLTGEGNLHLQFLTEYWRKQAPIIQGWTFYSSRQPSNDLERWQIEFGGEKFDPREFWLAPGLDKECEKIDLMVWHPLFPKLPESNRWSVIFLVLDEALGEFGTEIWIGEINMSDERLAGAFPLKELPAFISKTERETGWKKCAPTEAWTGYQIKDPHDRFRRDDIIVGTTANPKLLQEYLQSEDKLEDPLRNTGADYVFVQFSNETLPEGKQVDARGQIEERLEAALSSQVAGRHIGGAMGVHFAYIDLLITDGDKSLDIVQSILRECALPKGTSIEFFADSKRDARMVLGS